MPNQLNFRSNITTETAPKFFASRIINSAEENVLFEEIAGSFGYGQFDNVEIHFYELRTNVLVLSTVVRPTDTDVLKIQIVTYADNSYKTYLRIDFTKLFEVKQITLVPSTYKMVLNFFSDEIGSYNTNKLYIQEISPSRTELQLGFVDVNFAENETLLYEFIEKSFNKIFADAAIQKIFKSGVALGDPTEGITYDTLVRNIAVPETGQTYDNTIQRLKNLQLEELFKNSINQFIPSLYESIKQQIIIKDDQRIQAAELKQMIRTAVQAHINRLQTAVGTRIQVT